MVEIDGPMLRVSVMKPASLTPTVFEAGTERAIGFDLVIGEYVHRGFAEQLELHGPPVPRLEWAGWSDGSDDDLERLQRTQRARDAGYGIHEADRMRAELVHDQTTFERWVRGAVTGPVDVSPTPARTSADAGTGLLLEDLLDQSTLDWLEKVKRRGEV